MCVTLDFDTNRELENMKELKTQLSLALNYTARKRSSSVSDADMPFSAEMEVKSPTEKISVWKSYFSRSKRDNKLPGESKPSRPISNQTNNLKLPSQSVKMPSPTEENTPVRKISAPENHYDNFLTVSTPPTTPNSHSQGRRSSLKNFFGGKKEKKKYLKMSDTEIFARKLGEVNNIDSPKRHLSPQKFHFPRFFSHSHHLSRSTNSSSKIDAVSSDDSDGSEYEDQLAGLPDLIDLHSPNKTELSRTTPEGPLISPPIFRSDLMRNRSCSIDLADLPLRQTQPKAERNDDITAWSSQVAPTISPYTGEIILLRR